MSIGKLSFLIGWLLHTAASILDIEKFNYLSSSYAPTVGAVDRLCPVSSVVNNTCSIKNKDIRLTYDFKYETTLNLEFDNSEI